MYINRKELTSIALKLVHPNEDYDRIDIAQDTASMIADNIYIEFGGAKGMSLKTRQAIKDAFYEIALENIDWAACNRKRDPEEYADLVWRSLDAEGQL